VKGDTLVFVCGKARLEKKIKKVALFPTIGAVLKAVPRKKLMPSKASDAEVRKAYYSYPGYREKIAKHGIIAFYI
jgi:ASC-1-like (ASCH) protein